MEPIGGELSSGMAISRPVGLDITGGIHALGTCVSIMDNVLSNVVLVCIVLYVDALVYALVSVDDVHVVEQVLLVSLQIKVPSIYKVVFNLNGVVDLLACIANVVPLRYKVPVTHGVTNKDASILGKVGR